MWVVVGEDTLEPSTMAPHAQTQEFIAACGSRLVRWTEVHWGSVLAPGHKCSGTEHMWVEVWVPAATTDTVAQVSKAPELAKA